MSLFPKVLRDRKRIDLQVFPPVDFATGLVQLPVMAAAVQYGELIADFQSNAARLRRAQMMRVAGLSSADKTWLRCHELEMRFVTQPLRFGNDELALVDPIRNRIGPVRDKGRSQ